MIYWYTGSNDTYVDDEYIIFLNHFSVFRVFKCGSKLQFLLNAFTRHWVIHEVSDPWATGFSKNSLLLGCLPTFRVFPFFFFFSGACLPFGCWLLGAFQIVATSIRSVLNKGDGALWRFLGVSWALVGVPGRFLSASLGVSRQMFFAGRPATRDASLAGRNVNPRARYVNTRPRGLVGVLRVSWVSWWCIWGDLGVFWAFLGASLGGSWATLGGLGRSFGANMGLSCCTPFLDAILTPILNDFGYRNRSLKSNRSMKSVGKTIFFSLHKLIS